MYELDRPLSCSIGRAMEILGERWTFLILRESFYGVRRFSDIQRNLGIARNILSTRLQSLVAAGILERVRYQVEPERYEYRLSESGKDLYPAIVALMRWGDRHLLARRARPARGPAPQRLRTRRRSAAGLLALPRGTEPARGHARARRGLHRGLSRFGRVGARECMNLL